ncbi:hypothetical protein FOMPIDRAFT_93734 [Fomitopsis schrenkii]|uniref:Uncharacterized protein n=1 Tax=Fomitopsis schrenkii TaxID=2126942 RepID=S8DV91_FOMSC|nr:hypothetical protein FOMPIDRAFT_93734 [Fomitopsis schrenkii]
MDCSVTFSTPSPSPPSNPAVEAWVHSPSGDTDPTSEDKRACTAFDSSFQDSGYGSGGGESIHNKDLNHPHKEPSPSITSASEDFEEILLNPLVEYHFVELFGKDFPHKHKVFGDWFDDKLFPWLTQLRFGAEPSTRTIQLRPVEWHNTNIQHFIKFFYDYRTQTLTMSITTKLHAAGANQFFYANRAAPYSEENMVKEDGEMKVNRTMQVPDHQVTCIIEPKCQYRLRHMKVDSDASQRKDSEDGQKEKEAPPLKQAASSKQGKVFSAQLYSMEVSHSETLQHTLYKVGAVSYTPMLARLSSALADHVLTTVNMVSPLTCRSLIKIEEQDIKLEDLDSTPTPSDISNVNLNIKLEELDNDVVPPERCSSRLQERAPALATLSLPSPPTPTMHVLSRTFKPELEAEVISILPVVVVNLQDGDVSHEPGLLPQCQEKIIATANIDVTLYKAPRNPLTFHGSQWAEDRRFLGPERFGTILVFPDVNGLKILRKGVANGWKEAQYIEAGYGMHIVPDIKNAPEQVKKEYAVFKDVWRRYIIRIRRLQCIYEAFAVAALYGPDSKESNAWLVGKVPKLQAEVEKMPDGSEDGDWGLQYMIEVMAEGLIEAAEEMGADNSGMFSTGNTKPKLAMSVMSSKKCSLAVEDVLDVADDSKAALQAYGGLLQGAKKLRIHEPVVPDFVFPAKGWVNPKVNAEADIVYLDVDEAVQKVEDMQNAADTSYDPSEDQAGRLKGKQKARQGKARGD